MAFQNDSPVRPREHARAGAPAGCCAVAPACYARRLRFCQGSSDTFCAGRQTFLLFGKSGWIGGLVGELLQQQGARFEYATARLEDRAGVVADIERVRATSSSIQKWAVSKSAHDPRPTASALPRPRR